MKAARSVCGFSSKIEVECRSVEEGREAAGAGADIVMLDNFQPQVETQRHASSWVVLDLVFLGKSQQQNESDIAVVVVFICCSVLLDDFCSSTALFFIKTTSLSSFLSVACRSCALQPAR